MDFEELTTESMKHDDPIELASFAIRKVLELTIDDPTRRSDLLTELNDAVAQLDADSRLALGSVLEQRIFESHGRGAYSGQVPLIRRLTTVEAHIVHDALVEAGIEARIRREHISAADVLHPTNGVEVWIKPRDLNSARGLLDQLRQSADTQVKCSSCGESSPGHFGACWNCGAPLDNTTATSRALE